jgi:hypothetical protein
VGYSVVGIAVDRIEGALLSGSPDYEEEEDPKSSELASPEKAISDNRPYS